MSLRWLDPNARARREEELDEEIRSHLRMAEADRVAGGEPPAAAAANARREFGNVVRVKEITRETWSGAWLERLSQDLGFGLRMLRRSPGVSALAVLCLTLGIGPNTAVLSWVEGILFRPYPAVRQQERLLVLAGTARGEAGFDGISWPDFLDLQRSCRLFDSFIADKITGVTLSIGDRAERVSAAIVSANYFTALGLKPALGRGFTPDEEVGRNAHPVTVISYQLWRGRYRGDPKILGRTQRLNGVPHTIVGVAPKGFYGTFVGYAFQFWVPASMQERFDATGYKLEDRGARWIEGFVRLKPGVSAAQAQEEISAVARRLEATYPATNRGRGVALLPLWKSPFNGAGVLMPALRISFAVAAFVLLIACANVGNLLLVRSFSRRNEMTVRLAVGSGRRRLLQQLVTEGLLLSALATGGGLVVAYWLRGALVQLIPPRGVTLNIAGEIDWRVVAMAAGICLFSTLLFSLAPALQASKVDLAAALRSESGGGGAGGGRLRLRSGLVLVQVSLSFVLLVGAGLLVQSVQRTRISSPGFSTRNVLVSAVDLLAMGYDGQRARILQDRLLDRVEALPGVEAAAYARVRPFGLRPYSSAPIAVDGYQAARDEQPAAEYNEVGPAYLATLGIPLVSGREFTRADDAGAPLVAVVNEAMAAKYWPGKDPVGKRLRVKDRWMQVVGVARQAQYQSFLDGPEPFFYVPLRQNPSVQTDLNIRTSADRAGIAAQLVRELHALDADVSPGEVISLREQVDRSTAAQRVAVTLLGTFGALALLLAAIGLYGVMSYTVSQSTRDLGLRSALGARAFDLWRLVMASGLGLTAGGVVLGAAAALGTTRLLGHLLYQVGPRDPLTFAVACAVMAVVSLAACAIPARRAMQVDPGKALRG